MFDREIRDGTVGALQSVSERSVKSRKSTSVHGRWRRNEQQFDESDFVTHVSEHTNYFICHRFFAKTDWVFLQSYSLLFFLNANVAKNKRNETGKKGALHERFPPYDGHTNTHRYFERVPGSWPVYGGRGQKGRGKLVVNSLTCRTRDVKTRGEPPVVTLER